MNVFIFGLAAIALYLTVAVQTSEIAGPVPRPLSAVLACLASAAHALALYPMLVTTNGINLGIFSAASLVAWLIAAIVIVATLRAPVASLAIVILPFTAIIVAISLLFRDQRLMQHLPPGLALHIGLSLIAYSLFAIAALQAIYLRFAAHRLKSHTPVLRFLPPLASMEQLMFQLTGIAFVLLSLGLLVGVPYIHDVHAQHLGHKIVFSALAWSIFAVLLLGRYRWHWRGRRAVQFLLAGFVMLAIGFFGSKFVLELVLHRA
jgi:ABC-type uncharacterized transport system permease subunit